METITSEITNITLEGANIRVYLTLSNGQIETNLFGSNATSQDILNWQIERNEYWNNLVIKVEELKQQLIKQ